MSNRRQKGTRLGPYKDYSVSPNVNLHRQTKYYLNKRRRTLKKHNGYNSELQQQHAVNNTFTCSEEDMEESTWEDTESVAGSTETELGDGTGGINTPDCTEMGAGSHTLEDHNMLQREPEDESSADDNHCEPSSSAAQPEFGKFADEEADVEMFESEDQERETDHDENQSPCSFSDEYSTPLYDGARLTVAASSLLIISFAMRHNLTGQGLKDLLPLLDIHCPVQNHCHRSAKMFYEFFEQLKSPVQNHYVCEYCSNYIGPRIGQPANCDVCTTADRISSFIVVPLREQLSNIFSCQFVVNQLQQHMSQPRQPNFVDDIIDGELHKEAFSGLHFRGTPDSSRDEIHTSLQLNTDGVSLFKNSNYSVWPMYFTVNELPPKIRYSRKCRLFCGLWYGKQKPNMSLFLTPFVKELQSLYTDGMDIQVDGRRKTLKSVLLSVVCDAPARCLTTSMTQFNGYFGCTTCEAPGKSVAVGKGHAHVYPYDISEQRFHDGHAILRTHSKTKQQGLDAVESGEAVQGVKGYSPLLELPKFNIIRGVTVDYMHCVLLGVVKSFISLRTNKSKHTCDWYIGNRLKDVDKRLLSIQPPKLISRAPHSLTDTSNWKASEYRSFLLYYALGCLYGILPDSYFNHFALLVQGIYLLLQKSVAKSDIKRANNLLKQFCISIEEMYGARYETFNMHSLLHLADKTEDLGPLWCHSCFFYEDLNGDLRNLFHGTQQVHRQITLAVSVQQNIPKLVSAIPIWVTRC